MREYALQQGAWGLRYGSFGERVQAVAQAPGDAGLPRQGLQGGEVRLYADVGESRVESARDGDDVASRGGVVDGPAEGQAVCAGARQLAQEDVSASVGAQEVGVDDADDVGAGGSEVLHGDRGRGLNGLRLAL